MIDRVVVHPTDESFAVFELPNTSATTNTVSRIAILRPTSAVPIAVRSLPFSVRAAISSPSFSSSPSDPTSYAFVGITNSWGVHLFGDDIRLPDEQGSSARGLGDEGAAGPSKRTLFHDIFGASALVEPTAAPQPVEVDTTHPWRGKEIAEIFDAPTHLMPPVASLFDAVVDSFLTVKPASGAAQAEDVEEEERQDEDVEMEDQTGPVLSEERIERVADRREMRTFIDLFKHCAIKGKYRVPSHRSRAHAHCPARYGSTAAGRPEKRPASCERQPQASHQRQHPSNTLYHHQNQRSRAQSADASTYAYTYPGARTRHQGRIVHPVKSLACRQGRPETQKVIRLINRCIGDRRRRHVAFSRIPSASILSSLSCFSICMQPILSATSPVVSVVLCVKLKVD